MSIRKTLFAIFAAIAVSNAVFAQDVAQSEIAIAPVSEEPALTQISETNAASVSESAPVQATPPTVQYQHRTTQGATSSYSSRGISGRSTPQEPRILKIFRLQYTSADETARMVSNVFRIQVYADNRTNSLIVNATNEEMSSVEELIKTIDIPQAESSKAPDVQNLVYRVYMFEIPSADQTVRPFSMVLRVPADLPSSDLLVSAKDKGIQISDFLISDEDHNQQNVDIFIQGQAPSNESISEFADLTAGQIRELKWDDEESFTGSIEAAQYTRLPEELQGHIKKFLGEYIQTVGYWFGNSSAPGQVETPIGPWILKLQLDVESNRMLELDVEVQLPSQTSYVNRGLIQSPSKKILSNTMRVKIGKPIIIGYNRESYGTRKMGAMVIVPEADSLESDASATMAL